MGAAPTALHGRPADRLIRCLPTAASCTCPPSQSRSGSPGGSGSCFAWILPRQWGLSVAGVLSMVPHFNALVLQLMELLENFGLGGCFRHLPGKENVLSDGIPRLSGNPEHGPLRLDAVFSSIPRPTESIRAV